MLGYVAQPKSPKRESFQRKDTRSGTHAQAELPSFYPDTSLAGPLRSTGITPLPRYYAPRRLPTRAVRTVMISRPPLDSRPPGRVSQVPGRSIGTRCPLSPRRVRQEHLPVATLTIAGFTLSGGLATLTLCNEAETGSITCGSHRRLTRLRTPDCSDARSFGYMSNGQFTWQAPFSLRDLPSFAWRTRGHRGKERMAFLCDLCDLCG
jgi:hypothetical protein